jgi:hypothetical protein
VAVRENSAQREEKKGVRTLRFKVESSKLKEEEANAEAQGEQRRCGGGVDGERREGGISILYYFRFDCQAK